MQVRIIAEKKSAGFDSVGTLNSRLEAILSLHAQRTIEKLKIYPSMTAPSGYVRTGRLRDEWRSFRSTAGGDISYVIINDAKDVGYGRYRRKDVHGYATFVQGRKQTGPAKSIGWKTAEELLDREGLAKDVQNEIARYLGGR
jgi:hypothetical protein